MDKETTDCATILNKIEQCLINLKPFTISSIEQFVLTKNCMDKNNLTENKKFILTNEISANGNSKYHILIYPNGTNVLPLTTQQTQNTTNYDDDYCVFGGANDGFRYRCKHCDDEDWW